MKRLKLALVFLTAFATLVAATSADARWHHHRGARVGVFIGAPIVAYSAWPRYYYPPAYYPYAYPYAAPVVAPAPVYAPPAPPAYVEQTPPAAASGGNYWYYCRDSQAYYPHVQSCPSPWQPVVPNS